MEVDGIYIASSAITAVLAGGGIGTVIALVKSHKKCETCEAHAALANDVATTRESHTRLAEDTLKTREDIASIKADIRNMCRSLDEVKDDVREMRAAHGRPA